MGVAGLARETLVAAVSTALWIAVIVMAATRPPGESPGDARITLRGVVETPSGSPPVTLRLYTERGGRAVPRLTLLLDPDPRFTIHGIEPGLHHLVATSAGRIASRTIALTGRGRTGPLVLRLEDSRTLTGRVLGRGGTPLEARVTVEPETLAGDPTAQHDWFPARDVLTDAQGLFRIDGLPAGACRVSARAEGHLGEERMRVPLPGALTMRLEAHAALRVRVARKVGDAGSLTVQGARVVLHETATGVTREGLTDAGGIAIFVGLAPGAYSVEGRHGELMTYVPEQVALEEGQRPTVTLYIEPGLALEGMVVEAGTSAPVEGACVVASSRTESPRLTCSTSDVKGRFRISGLAPGRFALVVQAAGYLRERLPLVKLSASSPPAPLHVEMDRSMRIEGRVSDGNGLPVSGARIFVDDAAKLSASLLEGFLGLHLPDLVPSGPGVLAVGELGVTLGPVPPVPIDPGSRKASAPEHDAPGLPPGCECLDARDQGPGRGATTAADGTFRLDGIAPGEVTLVAVHPLYATLRSAPVLVAADVETPSVSLVMDRGGTIGGRVTDTTGSPLPDALVWIEGPTTYLSQPIVTGTDGTYVAGHVAGEVKVSVTRPGYFSAARTVFIESGSSSLTVDIVLQPEGKTVKGRVLDPWAFPVEEALVSVTSGQGSEAVTRAVRSDGDGMFSFPAIPGSPWILVISHPTLRTLRTVVEPWGEYEEPTFDMGFAAGVSGWVRDGWSHMLLDRFTVTVLVDGEKVAHRAFQAGRFTLTDLPEGACMLVIAANVYETLTVEHTLPRGSGPTEVTLPDLELWLDPLDPGA
jgi:protocatechuate 3,4-dioxygenase beta subunit